MGPQQDHVLLIRGVLLFDLARATGRTVQHLPRELPRDDYDPDRYVAVSNLLAAFADNTLHPNSGGIFGAEPIRQHLGVSSSTFRRWSRAGDLDFVCVVGVGGAQLGATNVSSLDALLVARAERVSTIRRQARTTHVSAGSLSTFNL